MLLAIEISPAERATSVVSRYMRQDAWEWYHGIEATAKSLTNRYI